MTVNVDSTVENKIENHKIQEKIDTNASPKKEEANVAQKQQENKKEDEVKEDPNWRAFREARKKDRADKEAAEKRAIEKQAENDALKAAMEAAFAKSSPISHNANSYGQQIDQSQEETEDEKIDKKVRAALAAREIEYERKLQEREKEEAPKRLMQTHPDFNRVVTQDNCDYMDYHYPELTAPFKYMPEGYEKWVAMYKLVNKFIPNSANAKKDAAKADSNQNKPKSISSMGITQPGESVNRGSMQEIEARRSARYAEMQRIIKGVG